MTIGSTAKITTHGKLIVDANGSRNREVKVNDESGVVHKMLNGVMAETWQADFKIIDQGGRIQ